MKSLAEALGTAPPPLEEADVPEQEFTIEEFCQGILRSKEYRVQLESRVRLGILDVQIEKLIWFYAFGRPIERHEHTGRDGKPIETVTEVRRTIVRVSALPSTDEQDDEQTPAAVH